jgi:hypothetical protein
MKDRISAHTGGGIPTYPPNRHFDWLLLKVPGSATWRVTIHSIDTNRGVCQIWTLDHVQPLATTTAAESTSPTMCRRTRGDQGLSRGHKGDQTPPRLESFSTSLILRISSTSFPDSLAPDESRAPSSPPAAPSPFVGRGVVSLSHGRRSCGYFWARDNVNAEGCCSTSIRAGYSRLL